MLVGYMRVSSELNDKQNTNLQLDALLKAGVDRRNIFEDYISGSKDLTIKYLRLSLVSLPY